MIGTIIIAVVGYGMAAGITACCAHDLYIAHLASTRGQSERSAKHCAGALLGAMLAIGFAAVTRWLIAGQF